MMNGFLIVFVGLMMGSSSFSQTHPGGGEGGGGGDGKEPISLSSLPEDRMSDYNSDLNELLSEEPDPKNPALSLEKKMSFIEVNFLIKKLIKQSNDSQKKHCASKKIKLRGLIDIMNFNSQLILFGVLQKKNVNTKCDHHQMSCHLRDQASITLKLLVESKGFVDYMVEKRGFKKEEAIQVLDYLKTMTKIPVNP